MGRSRRRWILPAIVAAGILFVLFFAVTPFTITLPDSLVSRFAPWTKEENADWQGDGRLIGHFDDQDPMASFDGWEHGAGPPAGPFGTGRCVLVYLPQEYDPAREEPYPVVYALHGFGNRPYAWVSTLLPELEQCIRDGSMPPSVVVMPDFSISGNGEAEGAWPGDGRAGSWYVDSNLGSYESWFFDHLRPWLTDRYHISSDSSDTALIGTSMGGYGALYYALTREGFADTAAAVYPMADLRFAASGSRLAAYDSRKYSPIRTDRPRRAMMALDGIGLFGVSESFFIGQAFATDSPETSEDPAPVWPADMPVWERMASVNPVDILHSGEIRPEGLDNLRILLTCGTEDEFNFHNHLPVISSALEGSGTGVTVELNDGLAHGWWSGDYPEERLRTIRWLGANLR